MINNIKMINVIKIKREIIILMINCMIPNLILSLGF